MYQNTNPLHYSHNFESFKLYQKLKTIQFDSDK